MSCQRRHPCTHCKRVGNDAKPKPVEAQKWAVVTRKVAASPDGVQHEKPKRSLKVVPQRMHEGEA